MLCGGQEDRKAARWAGAQGLGGQREGGGGGERRGGGGGGIRRWGGGRKKLCRNILKHKRLHQKKGDLSASWAE